LIDGENPIQQPTPSQRQRRLVAFLVAFLVARAHMEGDGTALQLLALQLLAAVEKNDLDAVTCMLRHPLSDGLMPYMHSALMCAVSKQRASGCGYTVDMTADMTTLLLGDKRVDAGEMLRRVDGEGRTALLQAVRSDAPEDIMSVLLGHSGADAAAMLLASRSVDGETVLMCDRLDADQTHSITSSLNHSTVFGVPEADRMQFLLGHPAADPAAMLAARMHDGTTVFEKAALHAVRPYHYEEAWDDGEGMGYEWCWETAFEPLLLLLRRDDLPPPSDADLVAVMNYIRPAFEKDFPSVNRDECVRLLLTRGAPFPPSPTMSRIVRELAIRVEQLSGELDEMRRLPHDINEAVVGLAGTQR